MAAAAAWLVRRDAPSEDELIFALAKALKPGSPAHESRPPPSCCPAAFNEPYSSALLAKLSSVGAHLLYCPALYASSRQVAAQRRPARPKAPLRVQWAHVRDRQLASVAQDTSAGAFQLRLGRRANREQEESAKTVREAQSLKIPMEDFALPPPWLHLPSADSPVAEVDFTQGAGLAPPPSPAQQFETNPPLSSPRPTTPPAEDTPAARGALRSALPPPGKPRKGRSCGGVTRAREGVERKRFTRQEQQQLRMAAEALQWSTKAVEPCEPAAVRVCLQVGVGLKQFKKWMANHRPKVLRGTPDLYPLLPHHSLPFLVPPNHLLFPTPQPRTPPLMTPFLPAHPHWTSDHGGDFSSMHLPPLLTELEGPPAGEAGKSSPPERLKENIGRLDKLVRTWVEERVEVLLEKRLAGRVGVADGAAGGPPGRDEVVREAKEVTEKLYLTRKLVADQGPHTATTLGSPSPPEADCLPGQPCLIGNAAGGSHLEASKGTPTGYLGTQHKKSQVQEVLFELLLTAADTGPLGRIVLPTVAARRFLPAVEGDKELEIHAEDSSGGLWGFFYRVRGPGGSSTCVFENTQGFVKQQQLRPGDTLVFCCTTTGHLLLVARRKTLGLALPADGFESEAAAAPGMPETQQGQQESRVNLVYPLVLREGSLGSDALVVDLETMRKGLVDLPIVGSSVAICLAGS